MNPYEELEKLFAEGKLLHYANREVIIPSDEEPKGAYRIVSGRVKVTTNSIEGSEKILYIYGKGDVFPVTWLFDRRIADIDYVAASDTNVLLIPRDRFHEHMMTEPGALLPIVIQQTEPLSALYTLFLDTAIEKVANRLIMLAQKFGEQNGDHVTLGFKISQQEIANAVHLSRETTNRLLAVLEDKGAIIQGRRLRIYPERLYDVVYKK